MATRIAIIGGGITGATACTTLLEKLAGAAPAAASADRRRVVEVDVDVYDQGRGLGGRTAHRAYARTPEPPAASGDDDGGGVHADEGGWVAVDPDATEFREAGAALRFDHGCQFFTARGAAFARLAERWRSEGWCEVWEARRGIVRAIATPSTVAACSSSSNGSFFGLSDNCRAYVGVDGMHRMAIGMLQKCEAHSSSGFGGRRVRVSVHRGRRVARVVREGAAWRLLGTSGEAAAHDSAEALAAAAEHEGFGVYDKIIVTDISCSFGGWHRASAGLPGEAVRFCGSVVRVPLFTTLVAFDRRLSVPLDAITFEDDKVVWFASRTFSKPNILVRGSESVFPECWSIVSTPGYAVEEIQRVPMQNATTGAFVPQSREYLESDEGPAKTMLRAFTAAIQAHGGVDPHHSQSESAPRAFPQAIFISAQRWGSACPSFANRLPSARRPDGSPVPRENIVSVLGVEYSKSENMEAVRESVVPEEGGSKASGGSGSDDFFRDDSIGLYYAGDMMVSSTTSDAGVEIGVGSAAMSAVACAEHVARLVIRCGTDEEEPPGA